MKVDDIISYHDLVTEEKANLQKGINFGSGRKHSVFLMSVRKGAPYADAIDPTTGDLLYEGHDEPKTATVKNPKKVDQPLKTKGGILTENGKFFAAAKDFKNGATKDPHLIKVYEKITKGIWSYKGFFELVDAEILTDRHRKVFKFHLRPVEKTILGGVTELAHTRIIPTSVKLEVWKRDGGKCVECGRRDNLHYDHHIPFSKGGSSLTAENVRLLCIRHNLEKSDKIMCFIPWVLLGFQSASRLNN